jgi:hypothetical protein
VTVSLEQEPRRTLLLVGRQKRRKLVDLRHGWREVDCPHVNLAVSELEGR